MIEQKYIRQLNLSEEEIEQLNKIADTMQYTADLVGSDIFIDCLDYDKSQCIVVAEAKPTWSPSLYSEAVVGKRAYPENEPAVFSVFSSAMPVRDIRAVTQENKLVKQDVIPVKNKQNKVFAVFIKEKDISKSVRFEKKYKKMAQDNEHMSELLLNYNGNATPYNPSVDENVLAMKEINHRVKNNLQMIASILSIQARRSKQPDVKKIFRENISRVLSIASIHDILTQTEFNNELSIKKIIEKVRDNIIICLYDKYRKIEISVVGDEFYVSSGKASSIAIVVNELITNAYEHAFKDRSEGTIKVTINHGNEYSSVTVTDDGMGFDIDSAEGSGLGLDLARVTVEDKLKGKIKFYSSETGSKISFDFNN